MSNEQNEKSLEEFGYKQELKRALTFKDLLFYGMVFMIKPSLSKKECSSKHNR